MQRLIFHIVLLLGFLLMETPGLLAQCTQCKTAAAAKDEAGNLYIGASMNTGILYLLALPFLAVLSVGGYWYYKNHMARKQENVLQ